MRIHQAARDIRDSIGEYLTTTFGGVDHEALGAICDLIAPADGRGGIFRGPYLQFRTPFVTSDSESKFFDWQPDWFAPHAHQALAWQRLGGAKPTIVTTGTGSGKTESFLFPILEHCRRARADKERGIKAIIIYPMNALAFDQAGRIAETIHEAAELAGIRVGLYAGETGKHDTMSADRVIDSRETLRESPPDILLTNYRMLDLLVGREADQPLWQHNDPDTLRYVVLDEFHTYDGAQGTDVALLLRRLGGRLGMRFGERALGSAIPVATSATLGSGADAKAHMARFASDVFGCPIGEDAFIEEQRLSAEASLEPVDDSVPMPSASDLELVSKERDLSHVAALFVGDDADESVRRDRLLRHPLLHLLVERASEEPVAIEDLARAAQERFEAWQRADHAAVAIAIAQFADLVTLTSRSERSKLFHVAAHLWARDVRRVNRRLAAKPEFRFEIDLDTPAELDRFAPAIHCISCRRTGWMFLAAPGAPLQLRNKPDKTRRAAVERSKYARAVIRAFGDESDAVRHLDVDNLYLTQSSGARTLPVFASDDEEHARRQQCPCCDAQRSIQFIGARIATIASVATTALFRSDESGDSDRKLLAFADSVQDASHRAAFLGARTHRFNLRASIASRLGPHDDGMSLHDMTAGLVDRGSTDSSARRRRELVPADLLMEAGIEQLWDTAPDEDLLDRLSLRLQLDAQLEFGLNAHVGRSLTTTFTVAPHVRLEGEDLVARLQDALDSVGAPMRMGEEPPDIVQITQGIVDRMLVRGAVRHPWLDRYRTSGGNTFLLNSREHRPRWAPTFPRATNRPEFPALGSLPKNSGLVALSHVAGSPNWYQDWLHRTAGLDPHAAGQCVTRILRVLRDADLVHELPGQAPAGDTVTWALEPDCIELHGTSEDPGAITRFACDTCAAEHAIAELQAHLYDGARCRGYRCPGSLHRMTLPDTAYYRNLYNHGTTRVISAEHTGLLNKETREGLELAFKNGTSAGDPNLVVCTPTLEMGVDIGDLSAVMLTGVPPNVANYIQRAGRSGRKSGNALTLTICESDPRSLYWFTDPPNMIAGDVTPPDCFLTATDILKRHLFAWLVDQAVRRAAEDPSLPRPPETLYKLAQGGPADPWLSSVLDGPAKTPEHTIDEFLRMIGPPVDGDVDLRAGLIEYLRDELVGVVQGRVRRWRELDQEQDRHVNGLAERVRKLEKLAQPTEQQVHDLRDIRGELRSAVRRRRHERDRKLMQGFDLLGLVPNYALPHEPAHLTATLRSRDDETGEWHASIYELDRPQRQALREFAPGAKFYAHAHKFAVTGVDLRATEGGRELPTATWYLCPECGWGQALEEAPSKCIRCARPQVRDQGARFKLMPIEHVTCDQGERSSRVSDDAEQREIHHFATQTTVDVDPKDVPRGSAWESADAGFAWESARASVRRYNFGSVDSMSTGIHVAGVEHKSNGFSICRSCGVEAEAGRTRFVGMGKPYELVHRRRCRTHQHGEQPDTFEERVVLFHEQPSDVVRLLMPITSYLVDERLASVKSAILRGLLREVGGSADHIEFVSTSEPGSHPDSRRRLLVLIDSIPGGTGYLSHLRDPEAMHRVLVAAHDLVRDCPCRAVGAKACHRCLYHPRVPSSEFEYIDREHALEVLTGILRNWKPERIDALNDVNIQHVEESELERRFRHTLGQLAITKDDRLPSMSMAVAADGKSHLLTIGRDDTSHTWRITEQITKYAGDNVTVPDFTFRLESSTDEQLLGTGIDVFADGYRYHANPDDPACNRIAGDAAKRHELRHGGALVWNLTWDDVVAVGAALDNGTLATLHANGERPMPSHVRTKMRAALDELGEDPDLDRCVTANAMLLLLDVLADPRREKWRTVATTWAIGVQIDHMQNAVPSRWGVVSNAGLVGSGASDYLRAGRLDRPLDTDVGGKWVAVHTTGNDIAGTMLIADLTNATDLAHTRFSALHALPDRDADLARAGFADAWREWLHVANLLQFVAGEETSFVMTGTSTPVCARQEMRGVPVTDSSSGSVFEQVTQPVHTDHEWMQRVKQWRAGVDLEYVDPASFELLDRALKAGPMPLPRTDGEVAGIPVDFVWGDEQVVLTADTQDLQNTEGWSLVEPSASVEELRGRLGAST